MKLNMKFAIDQLCSATVFFNINKSRSYSSTKAYVANQINFGVTFA